MKNEEWRAFFKGLGIAMILCAAIFYGMVINLRMNYETKVISNEDVVLRARELGMMYLTEVDTTSGMTDEDIISAAKKLGMIFTEDEK